MVDISPSGSMTIRQGTHLRLKGIRYRVMRRPRLAMLEANPRFRGWPPGNGPASLP
ncbi:MAG: hypothetical protein QOJ42_7023 [Acidobacteriaceae bacterium]|nr:hypothetical protein [Acidobacteriaceae bacterium]